MNLIRLNPTRWPYSLQQLREDEPGRSFSAAPRAHELAYFQVFAVQPTAQPAFDPDLQKVMEVMPVLVEGVWQQQWEVVTLTEEEQAERYRLTHPPRWVEFAEAVSSDPAVAELYEQAPCLLAHSLTGGLLQAVNQQDPRTFAAAWNKARAALLVQPPLEQAIRALAEAHDLPQEFVAALGPQLTTQGGGLGA
jgi:hypothetical protein